MLTDLVTTLAGAVELADGTAPGSCLVVLFPVDRTRHQFGTKWVQVVRLRSDRQFQFEDVEPAEYWVAAILDPDAEVWREAGVLAELEGRATRVTLTAGQSGSVSLRLGR